MRTTLTKLKAESYKRSFYKFSLEAFKVLHNGQPLVENWHIEYICNELQKEAERIVKREPRNKHLLINVPPRTLKSELVNVFFSVYLWILDDSIQFISSSYSASLSVGLSVQARRLILSDWFQTHFPHIHLSTDEKQKSKFSTPKGGLRYCTSTGGTVTGMGGDVIVIDDPQNPQLARSDIERDNANRFFNQTLRSRLNDPKVGMFIVIMQRLHENDLTGMLLKEDADNWQHICLPAELTENVIPSRLTKFYDDGLLFPQRLSKSVLDSFKIGLGSYGYSGQYMQLPSPADGGMIKRDWFNIINELPKDNNNQPLKMTWDFFLDTAYTNKTYNDATAMIAVSYHNEKLYIKKVEAVRLEFPELIKKITEFTSENGYTNSSRIFIEPKASGKSIVQQLKRNTGLNVIEDKPPTQDKVSRVNSVSAIIQSGRVNLLDGRYIDSFLNECASFPNGNHDDQVDVLVMAIDKYTARRKNIKAFAI
jgi:predicted phage terminase large subunit-like protein